MTPNMGMPSIGHLNMLHMRDDERPSFDAIKHIIAEKMGP